MYRIFRLRYRVLFITFTIIALAFNLGWDASPETPQYIGGNNLSFSYHIWKLEVPHWAYVFLDRTFIGIMIGVPRLLVAIGEGVAVVLALKVFAMIFLGRNPSDSEEEMGRRMRQRLHPAALAKKQK